MQRPITETLAALGHGSFIDEASNALNTLVTAVDETGRAGKLSFWYELLREDKVLEDAARAEITTIGEQTGIKVLQGNPRLSRD